MPPRRPKPNRNYATMSQALIDVMHREAQAALAFADTLQQERAAIRAGDFLALSGLIETKQELAQELARLGAARQAQMAAHGIRVGPQRELVGLNVDPAVADGWRDLQLAARGAADATALTGMVVNAHLKFTGDALQALRQRGGNATVYGRDGRTENGPRGVSLASG